MYFNHYSRPINLAQIMSLSSYKLEERIVGFKALQSAVQLTFVKYKLRYFRPHKLEIYTSFYRKGTNSGL